MSTSLPPREALNQVPQLLGIGKSLGVQGRWHLMMGDKLWGLGTGTPMLEDIDEGGIRPWHLVKPSEEPEPPRPRRGSLRGGERERAKAIPEIYLTRLLSMKVGQGGQVKARGRDRTGGGVWAGGRRTTCGIWGGGAHTGLVP